MATIKTTLIKKMDDETNNKANYQNNFKEVNNNGYY